MYCVIHSTVAADLGSATSSLQAAQDFPPIMMMRMSSRQMTGILALLWSDRLPRYTHTLSILTVVIEEPPGDTTPLQDSISIATVAGYNQGGNKSRWQEGVKGRNGSNLAHFACSPDWQHPGALCWAVSTTIYLLHRCSLHSTIAHTSMGQSPRYFPSHPGLSVLDKVRTPVPSLITVWILASEL